MERSPPPHETTFRIRYGEVDRMGYAYHANYLVFFENGRTELLRSLGETYRRLEDEGTLLVVVETGVRHVRPAAYDDLVTVRTTLSELRGVRMRFDYELVREGEVLATGFTVLAATDPSGRPCRIPRPFRERIEAQVAGDGKVSRPAAVQQGDA